MLETTQARNPTGHKNPPNSVKPTFLPAKLVRTPTHQYESALLEDRLYTNDHPKSRLRVNHRNQRTVRQSFDESQHV